MGPCKAWSVCPPQVPGRGDGGVGGRGRGGSGRGQGRKKTPVNTPGVDAAGGRKRQADLGELLGMPRKLQKSDAGKKEEAGMIQWDYTQHLGGGDELIIAQRQKLGGRVECGQFDALFRLKKKGPEVYYVNEDDINEEVPFLHPKAYR